MDQRVNTGRYLMPNQNEEAGSRFSALASLFNANTCRHISRLGIQAGWRCWEVGAGGPSIPRWLAGQVGDSGRVVATDVDTKWLDRASSGGPTFDVVEHDVAHDDPPAGGFDLVHARLVLVHVPERDAALERMVRALRPGGWLVIEDFDPALQPLAMLDEPNEAHRLANRLRAGFLDLLVERGVDLEYGRKLPGLLAASGLTDIGADGYLGLVVPAAAELEAANVAQVRDALVARRVATPAQIDGHLAALTAGQLGTITLPPLISAWGRRAAR